MTRLISWTFLALIAGFARTHEFDSQVAADAAITSSNDSYEVSYPGSDRFTTLNKSLRWSEAHKPSFNMLVEVSSESDVQSWVRYANAHRSSFLAVSGGHGTSHRLGQITDGIGIVLHKFNNITIVDNGQVGLMEGGVQNGDVISYLWSQGKQTMTTGCDCVGYIAPILGGGHGWLQGRYGLAADQLISARMVLANGTIVSVSDKENPDLFWAIRGAGHNFGIVTQVRMRIYDREPEQDQWAASGFVFTHDKLESVFALANEWLDAADRPAEMIHYGLFAHNAMVDAVNPVVIMWIYYQAGTIPPNYTDPLYALSPVAVDSSVTDLAGVNTHLQATRDGAACAKGFSRSLLPVSLKRYSIPALRKVLDIFTTLPSEFRDGSVVMLEGFSTNRVSQIPSDSTAYPDREGQLLLSPLLTYPSNSALDDTAWKLAGDIRSVLVDGSGEKLNAYVNYARGDESLEEVYGHEPWRLEKLRRLKKEYDPSGRFNWFAPIS